MEREHIRNRVASSKGCVYFLHSIRDLPCWKNSHLELTDLASSSFCPLTRQEALAKSFHFPER